MFLALIYLLAVLTAVMCRPVNSSDNVRRRVPRSGIVDELDGWACFWPCWSVSTFECWHGWGGHTLPPFCPRARRDSCSINWQCVSTLILKTYICLFCHPLLRARVWLGCTVDLFDSLFLNGASAWPNRRDHPLKLCICLLLKSQKVNRTTCKCHRLPACRCRRLFFFSL